MRLQLVIVMNSEGHTATEWWNYMAGKYTLLMVALAITFFYNESWSPPFEPCVRGRYNQ